MKKTNSLKCRLPKIIVFGVVSTLATTNFTYATNLITNGSMNRAAGVVHSQAPDNWVMVEPSADVNSPGTSNEALPGLTGYPFLVGSETYGASCEGGSAAGTFGFDTSSTIKGEEIGQTISVVSGTTYNLCYEISNPGVGGAAPADSSSYIQFQLDDINIVTSSTLAHPTVNWLAECVSFTAPTTGDVLFSLHSVAAEAGKYSYMDVDNLSIAGEGDTTTAGPCFAPANMCGNGIVDSNETCDDNNTVAGDGCSDTCTVEVGYQCTIDNPADGICDTGGAGSVSPVNSNNTIECVDNNDTDGDTIPNCVDACPNTPAGGVVNAYGCPNDTDLSIVKTASVTNITVGQPFTYTLTVTNTGSEAHNVKVADAVSNLLTINSVTVSDSGTDNTTGQDVKAQWAIVPAGATRTVIINVTKN